MSKKPTFLYLDDQTFNEDGSFGCREPKKFFEKMGWGMLANELPNYDIIYVTSYAQAVDYLTQNGCPDFMSFDNDLGDGQKEGIDLAKWMIEKDLNTPGFIPEGFSFFVHSQNPIAATRIRDHLGSYFRYKGTMASELKWRDFERTYGS